MKTHAEINAENEGRKKLIKSLEIQMVKALKEIQRLRALSDTQT